MQLKTTDDIYHHLNSLGLTLNEAEIYVYLLKSGLSLGSHIHADLKKDKSSTYRAISNLIEHNLVYKVGEHRNQKFGANPQENLLAIVESKKSKLEETSLHLKNFLKTVQSKSDISFKNENTTIYKGSQGYKLFMSKQLQSKEKLLREISSSATTTSFYSSLEDKSDHVTGHEKRRVAEKIHSRGLIPENDTNTALDDHFKEFRTLPSNFEVGATYTTWDDFLGISSPAQKSEIICMLIHDPLITTMFKQIFDILWSQSKKIRS